MGDVAGVVGAPSVFQSDDHFERGPPRSTRRSIAAPIASVVEPLVEALVATPSRGPRRHLIDGDHVPHARLWRLRVPLMEVQQPQR